jgi:hypothetical protein
MIPLAQVIAHEIAKLSPRARLSSIKPNQKRAPEGALSGASGKSIIARL